MHCSNDHVDSLPSSTARVWWLLELVKLQVEFYMWTAMEVTLITFISSGSELISTLGNLLLLVVTSKVMTESDFGSTSAMNMCVRSTIRASRTRGSIRSTCMELVSPVAVRTSSIYPFSLGRLRFGSNNVVHANADANNSDQNRDNNQPCAFDDNSQRMCLMMMKIPTHP
ncbi:hypothetical protein GOBAR_DD17426 [Gossypium barbadense]|nr:hypothetical protein GOBAR_DD17426 [Gossypium barbadense]